MRKCQYVQDRRFPVRKEWFQISINKGPHYVALYERLSRDDEPQGESNSITNHKEMLESYAKANGFTPFRHFSDGGISGTTFERDGFRRMIAECEKGNITAVIVKDLSRFGRNYLTVGFYIDVGFLRNAYIFCAKTQDY